MSIQKRAKLLPWVAAFAVAALVAILTVPSLAAPTGTKYYMWSVSPSGSSDPVAVGSSQTFTVSIKNTSPKQSSSNISSVAIVVPNEFTISGTPTISSTSTNGTNAGATIAVNATGSTNCVAASGQQVSICNLDPVKSQKQVVVLIPATVGNAGLSCGGDTLSGGWSVTANTGSQLNGNNFDPDPLQPAPIKTTIERVCDSSISGQVWRDHDNDATKDSDTEGGQSGWTVVAFDSGTAVKNTTSASDGTYTLSGLEGGKTYKICEFAPASSPSYLGWIQSAPTTTPCSGLTFGGVNAEPNGYSVALASGTSTVTGKDFLNVQTIVVPGDTITVTCDEEDPTWPTGGVFTVGNGTTEPYATVTLDPPNCKPGEYVFESWVDANGDQQVALYPTFPPTDNLIPITQDVDWVITSDKTQSTLFYDDGAGTTEAKFCIVDENTGEFVDMPTASDTTCIMHTTEDATPSGVDRHDTIVTLVDGKLTLSK